VRQRRVGEHRAVRQIELEAFCERVEQAQRQRLYGMGVLLLVAAALA
jgi:hypothetical protein